MTETMGPMGALHGRHGSETSPQWWGDVSYAIQACLGLCLALLGPVASPNSPNGRFNSPLDFHPLPPPAPLPSHPPPITRHQ